MPWLSTPRTRLAAARAAGRMPHGLLIHGPSGVGQRELARWAAALVLCERHGDDPCGQCPSCQLLAAGNHPDLQVLTLEENDKGNLASVIKVEQVRTLASELSLKSYRGGAKLAIIDPADRLNANAANALLKTLEEPGANTLLILVASDLSRLPATIASRCQRVMLRLPAVAEAVAWLRAAGVQGDAEELLLVAAGSPGRALELAAGPLAGLLEELENTVDGAGDSRFDPLGTAERWSRDAPAERLWWLERWAEQRLRQAFGVDRDALNDNRASSLPSPGSTPMIRANVMLLDRVREARSLLTGSLNNQLLLEGVMLALMEAARSPSRRPVGR